MANSTCIMENCSRPLYGRGLCSAHWQRKRRGAPMDTPIAPPLGAPRTKIKPPCKVPGCDRPHFGKGYCSAHLYRFRNGLDLQAPIRGYYEKGQKCVAPGCEYEARANSRCSTHYGQWVKKHSTRKCRIECCGNTLNAKGLCQMHRNVELRYGISAEEWEVLYSRSGGKCGICEKPVTRGEAHTDHDHNCCPGSSNSCGRCVRGVLCRECNQGIGFLRDDLNILASAIKYLQSRQLLTEDA